MKTKTLSVLLASSLGVFALAAGCGSGNGDGDSSDDDGPGAIGQQVPWPTEEWTVKTPADMGMDAALIEEAMDYAFNNVNPPSLRNPGDPEVFPFGDTFTQSVIVIRGGAIVAERYAPDPRNMAQKDKDSIAASWSMAKSFSSTLIGILIDQGLIESVNVPMTTFYPEWAGRPGFSEITLRDVLQMQSGIDFSESYTDTDCITMTGDMLCSEVLEMGFQADQLSYMLAQERGLDPARTTGETWYYSSGDTLLLAGAVRRVAEANNLPYRNATEFAREVLFNKIGMHNNPLTWWEDVPGNTLGYCCLDTTSRNFAKFGLLFLRDGEWDGQQVVSKQWVEMATTDAAAGSKSYGYQWWLPGRQNGTTLPADIYAAEGQDDQRIFVIPSLDLVVVRNSIYKEPHPITGNPDLGGPVAERGFVPEFLPFGAGAPDPADNVPFGTNSGTVFLDCAFLGPIINSIQDPDVAKIEFCNDGGAPSASGGGDAPSEPTPLFGCRDGNETLDCRARFETGRYGPFCEEFMGCLCDGDAAVRDLLVTCDDVCGCREIVQCAIETGCLATDTFSCLIDCGDVIEKNGGLGSFPGKLVQELAITFDAAISNTGCARTCP